MSSVSDIKYGNDAGAGHTIPGRQVEAWRAYLKSH